MGAVFPRVGSTFDGDGADPEMLLRLQVSIRRLHRLMEEDPGSVDTFARHVARAVECMLLDGLASVVDNIKQHR